MSNSVCITVTTAEKTPFERFDELLASFSNTTDDHPQVYQRSLVYLLQRDMNHVTNEQRNEILHRFGAALSHRDCQYIDIESLATFVSSDEDMITLFHSSGFSHSILKQIQPNQTNNHRLVQLAQLSEIFPLVSIEPLSEDLSSLFRNFLCNPLPYLENDEAYLRSSFSALVDILCNEVMACAIVGIGDVVFETIVSSFHAFSESILREQTDDPDMDYDYRDFQMIVEISQNESEPVERIAAFIRHFENLSIDVLNSDGNHPMNLLSQCLQHTATFLNAHPDLIDSFLETVDLSASPSDTPFHHDRHLNLISALSQSSSLLFTKLSEPLLDPTFPLDSLLSPRSFTDPASSFIRMASTNPAFFRRLVEMHAERILDIAISTAVRSVRVASDSPSIPRCLDFGRMTQNWVVLLTAMGEVKMDLTLNSEDFNSLPSSLLTLLVLSAASTHDELSTAAVSVFSNQFGLSTPHTEALLFATPTTFPVSDAFTPRNSPPLGVTNRTIDPSQSLCAKVCCIVLKSHSDFSSTTASILASKLVILLTGCLVNAFHSTATLSHSFPFFSPELCGLSQQPSVWNDNTQPSALTGLTNLAGIVINFAFPTSQWEPNLTPAKEERRIINFVHLFPFLGPESQTQFLVSFTPFYSSVNQKIRRSLDGVVECLVEMATVNSYNTPIALLKEMRKDFKILFHADPEALSIEVNFADVTLLERSIVDKLGTAEGEVRWKLLTQLVVVSRDTPDITNELTKAENDAQALLILSLHTIHSTTRSTLHLDKNLDSFDFVVELAGHINNLPLVAAAMFHIADTVETCIRPLRDNTLLTNRKQVLQELVLNTLPSVAQIRREGVEEGCAVGKDEVTSQIVESCSKVMQFLMKFDSFNPSPVIDSLVSLAVTTDLSLLRSILLALQEIEERTRYTATPFSISRATAPFRGIHQSSVTQQPLPSIVASILLDANLISAYLDELPFFPQYNPDLSTSGFSRTAFPHYDSILVVRVLRGLNENLLTIVKQEIVDQGCLILEERRANSSTVLKLDDPFVISLALTDRTSTPQQLFLTLHTMILPDDQLWISAYTLRPLAPFLTRILTVVVPSLPDTVEIRHKRDELSQLLNSFLYLTISVINAGIFITLSTPPLSSLLSVLSIALVRLDTIPSSLNHHNEFCTLVTTMKMRFNTQMKKVVLALSEEGMEDRSDLVLNSLSLMFLNKCKGANSRRHNEFLRLDDFADLWYSDDSPPFDVDDDFGMNDNEAPFHLDDDDLFDDPGWDDFDEY
ncbi:hypothetical protein BLNAU_18318 [Blattamonas nauphoetae]|uniref:Mediator complex subunit 5 n=1 Tax=Blattamonas nauphoetae TaxID=2049346 RepID=A0ABQ9X733_9EUKA|nr:hypothetical protein BLNAU_18318 [Blattamonas nauphoetae]